MPASTSTLGRPITEIARLEGVPPNISVRIATPFAAVHALDRLDDVLAALLHVVVGADRHRLDLLLGPTTCSRPSELAARRPCVTSTRPIMKFPAGASPLHRTKGGPS
jgi:hypothetical protein